MFQLLKNVLFCLLVFNSTAQAEIAFFRWAHDPTKPTRLEEILVELNNQTNLQLTQNDFKLVEDIRLATSHFKTYSQMLLNFPIEGAMIRTWVDPLTGSLLQMEAHLDIESPSSPRSQSLRSHNLQAALHSTNELNTLAYVKKVVNTHPDDPHVLSLNWQDVWSESDFIRIIRVRSKHGHHLIRVSHTTRKIIDTRYIEHPQSEIQALVYPIYEEAEKEKGILSRQLVTLKNLNPIRKKIVSDPYSPLRERKYYYDKLNPVLGETEEGQKQGYWSMRWLLSQSEYYFNQLTDEPNSFDNGGVILKGSFATINLHPDATQVFKGIEFIPKPSGQLSLIWKTEIVNGEERYEIVPMSAYSGRPLLSSEDALGRIARRDPQHNPTTYINDGFDEIQVYYAINTFMESLQNLGFTDPVLSTRPFHAFLYDPDIAMRDNAYYTSDTINFTTYSANAQNYARDNSTIWHELGHGIMDRLMGDMIHLTDSGGLSEGMADFLAQIIIQNVTEGADFRGKNDFRIRNKIGFNLTNESHDDGEAYGGAMNDMLLLALQKFGSTGLHKFTDLTLETMRLTRNNPDLDANGWFEHMLYADELGRTDLRASGEMHDLILTALRTRNFNLDRSPTARFTVRRNGNELTDTSPGSRARPIVHELKSNQRAAHTLQVSLQSSNNYEFRYPVTVEVSFDGGPLQGAIHWSNEENGPHRLTILNDQQLAELQLSADGQCDNINREDESCVDFVYIKIFQTGETQPVAKKRFYLRIYPQS